ncbi:MAG TPA: fumarylacetoacetate hydrolase family protein [Pyrinomonadaceae bacterium]|nr:fumarylacetoacetate hydrolase family protein [Pyrinomonadaceae bacterium]
MKIASFKLRDTKRGETRLGLVIDGGVVEFDTVPDMLTLITDFSRHRTALSQLMSQPRQLADVKLEPPIKRPGKIICLAGNYRAHITESGYIAPAQTEVFTQQLFLKPATCITGDGDPILFDKPNVMVGWETELAVVIGKRGKHIDPARAYEYIFGYTILNDVSERRLNSRIENRTKREMDGFLDWLAGKWFDSFAPCGPWIVTADEIPDPHDLEIKLTVNGQIRQQGNTCDMIFKIPEQVAYISSIMTLEPGDIISTGTPVGAGIAGDSSLHDKDELVCEIEHIGSLRNTVRYVS